MKSNNFFAAAWRGDSLKMSKYLDDGFDANSLNDNETALFYITDISCAKALVANRININHQNDNGFTALHLSIILRNTALFELLLDAGANTDIKSNNGLDAIGYARNGYLKEYEVVIEREILKRAVHPRAKLKSISGSRNSDDEGTVGL